MYKMALKRSEERDMREEVKVIAENCRMEGRKRRDSVSSLSMSLLCLIITITESATVTRGVRGRRSPEEIAVGVILDSGSSLGSLALNCTSIGLHDFYSTQGSNYATNITLHFRESGNDLISAASAARDLINKNVHAIMGPQNSEQARFVVELGYKYDVPVIWFSPSGPSLLPPRSRFFIHSNSAGHCSQFEAIAAIIEAYNWQSVIPIYEEPEFGNDLIPCLSYALQEMDTRVPYISSISHNFTKDEIKAVLNKTKAHRTYVFLAHMTVELWSRLVEQAKEEGMMSEGYAWILTQGLSSRIDPEALDINVRDGALGVKPLWVVSNIDKLISFAKILRKYDKSLSLYGLWAYDTVTALAEAVEVVNETGQKLRTAIEATNFEGLSGNFDLRHRQLEPSEFVVYNLKDQKEITIGYWSRERGFYNHSGVDEPAGKFKLRDPTWPGNTKERPPKLKIGVPKTHFPELVNVSVEGQHISATGFAVEVFEKVVDALPFNVTYEYVPVNNTNNGELIPSSYDDLLCDIKNKNLDVDVIIGDITIVENRTDCVDFTLPYLDSSVSMVVKVRSDSKSGWILLKPFDLLLWLILAAILVGATVIVIILERKTKDDVESKFKHFLRNPFLIYMSDVEFLKSGTAKWVVIVVMFLLGIAVQVYTANLTSILTERTTAKPSPWRDLQEIKRNNGCVGYQSDSWVRDLLIHQIGLNENQTKGLESSEKYHEALSKGPKKGGVDVIFDETPYLRLLLSICTSCKMTGPIYKTGGFAFAFRQNSTLVPSFSAAILNVTQNVTTFSDMKKNASLPVNIDKSEYRSEVKTRSLNKDDFGGLFPIVFSILAFFLLLSILKVPYIAPWLHNKFVSFLSPSGGVILIKR